MLNFMVFQEMFCSRMYVRLAHKSFSSHSTGFQRFEQYEKYENTDTNNTHVPQQPCYMQQFHVIISK